MKKTIITLVIFITPYIIVAFVLFEPNVGLWNPLQRLIMIPMYFILMYIYMSWLKFMSKP